MQNVNATESVQQLRDQINKELQEMAKLQEEIRAHEAEATKLKIEIPQLQKQIDLDKHKLQENDRDLPRLKIKLLDLQREKLKLQGEMTSIQNSFRDSLRNQSIKLH